MQGEQKPELAPPQLERNCPDIHGSQVVHELAPTALYVPAAQLEHELAPAALYVPAAQLEHELAPAAL